MQQEDGTFKKGDGSGVADDTLQYVMDPAAREKEKESETDTRTADLRRAIEDNESNYAAMATEKDTNGGDLRPAVKNLEDGPGGRREARQSAARLPQRQDLREIGDPTFLEAEARFGEKRRQILPRILRVIRLVELSLIHI